MIQRAEHLAAAYRIIPRKIQLLIAILPAFKMTEHAVLLSAVIKCKIVAELTARRLTVGIIKPYKLFPASDIQRKKAPLYPFIHSVVAFYLRAFRLRGLPGRRTARKQHRQKKCGGAKNKAVLCLYICFHCRRPLSAFLFSAVLPLPLSALSKNIPFFMRFLTLF